MDKIKEIPKLEKYTPVLGSHLTKAQAKRYGPIIEELIMELGNITPERLLEIARDPESPLHDYFTWDDSKAAEAWRRQQALEIIHFININIEIQPGEVRTQRAFYSVVMEHGPVFVTANQVAHNDLYHKQVIEQAYSELLIWKRKYKEYKEFFKIIRDIDELNIQ